MTQILERPGPPEISVDGLATRLQVARAVLGGTDRHGRRTHPSMFDPDVMSLAHGDGTRRPHPTVVAAGIRALLDSSGGSLDDYLFLQRHNEFEQAIVDEFTTAGIPDHVAINTCVDSGTTRLFGSFLSTCVEPGEILLVSPGYYHPLPSWCELVRGDLRLVAPQADTSHKLTGADLATWFDEHRDVAERARVLFLFNPTQTGLLYTEQELADIGAEVARRNLLVLEDSVFAGTEFPGERAVRHLAGVVPELAGQVVTLRGASKAHNLANMRIGWACGPEWIVNRMRTHCVTTVASIPNIAKCMALAALRAPANYRSDNSAECADRVELVRSLVDICNSAVENSMNEPALTVPHQPQAGHAVIVSATGMAKLLPDDEHQSSASIKVAQYLLKRAKVAVSPGYSLGLDGAELRLVVGSVGLRSTYSSSAAAELHAAHRTLASFDSASAYFSDPGIGFSGEHHRAEVFTAGRRMIENIFIDRLLPALKSLTS